MYGSSGKVTRMKTTIELPDELLREVRELSRASGVTMRELMVEGLRSELARRREPRPQVDLVFTTVDGQGLARGLAPGDAIAVAYEPLR